MQELPKNHILRGYRAFSRVLSQGQKKARGSIRCFYLPAEQGKTHLRIGFAVARGIRNAPRRNRAKRLMREAFRQNRVRLFAKSRCTASEIILLYAGTGDAEIRYSTVEQEVVFLLEGLREKS